MKKLYTLVALIFLGFNPLTSLAQRGVPAAYAGDYNRIMSNNAMNMNMSMARMMNQRWYTNFSYLENYKYDYIVVMKDSSVLQVNSKINADTAKHKTYLLYVNRNLKRSDPNRERKIYPSETASISRIAKTFDSETKLTGNPTDSCWLFKVINGKINVYSHLSETENLNNYYLRAIQVGEGPIRKIDSASLAAIIKTDPKAMKAFIKKDFYKAIDRYNKDK